MLKSVGSLVPQVYTKGDDPKFTYCKKLIYRTETAQRAVSVELSSIAAQLYEKSHLKRPAR